MLNIITSRLVLVIYLLLLKNLLSFRLTTITFTISLFRMTYLRFLLPVCLLLWGTHTQAQFVYEAPYDELFRAVQKDSLFEDSKVFVDAKPLKPLDKILSKYQKGNHKKKFNLKSFVEKYFELPQYRNMASNGNKPALIEDYITAQWNDIIATTKTSDGTIIGVPDPYVASSGAFQEMHYWNSYFNMLGLIAADKPQAAKQILDNCSYLIDKYGYMPASNRSYSLSRSSPPVYSLMVKLIVDLDSTLDVENFLPYLEKEYRFWMQGADELTNMNSADKRVVLMPHGEIMNRYWDSLATPRPEAYREDWQIEGTVEGDSTRLFRNIRAAQESGWGFNSRWLGYTKSFATLQTTEIIPVDLNCLLYHLEITLSEAYLHVGDGDQAEAMAVAADYRKNGILKYCWIDDEGFFMDYAFWDQYHTGIHSLAGVFPLFFGIATDDQVLLVIEKLENEFLKEGGLMTSLTESGEAWDSPNGWAPLQYIAVEGLKRYQYNGLADDIIYRWTNNVNQVYEKTGKILAKYNVVEVEKPPVEGRYRVKNGFAWTVAIYLKFLTPIEESSFDD